MKRPTVLFRTLLVASIVSALVGGVIDLLIPELIPQSLREAQEALSAPEFTARDIGLVVIGLPYLVALVACTVALYRFRRWAPQASLYLTIASLVLYPFAGVNVASEWSTLLTEASAILWGAMLAMAHLPPLKERFAAVPANPGVQPTPESGSG